MTVRLCVADEEVRNGLFDLLTFGPFDGLVPSEDEDQRLREIRDEIHHIGQAQDALREMIVASPRQVKSLKEAWDDLQAKRTPLERDQQRILSSYVLRALFDEEATHPFALATIQPGDRDSGPWIDFRHLVHVAKLVEDFDTLAISQRRALVKQLTRVEILPDKALNRSMPQKDRSAARIVITAAHGGRRLNAPAEPEVIA